MSIYYNPSIVTDGLVLCLDAANRDSYPGTGTAWTDLSGNGNDGTLTNGPTFNSGNGGTIVFDGTDDYGSVSCAQFVSGNNSFSMEIFFMWFGNGVNNTNIIFAYGDDSGGNRVPLMAISTNKLYFSFGSNTGQVLSLTTISQNVWYHGICTYDKNYTKVYLNGILENSTYYTSANIVLSGSNGTNAGIGCLFSVHGNIVSSPRRYGTFNGKISSIKYYNRALTASEVLQNYNATRNRYGV